jgi:hypothetical protein
MSMDTPKTNPFSQEPSSADLVCRPSDVGRTTIGERHEEKVSTISKSTALPRPFFAGIVTVTPIEQRN